MKTLPKRLTTALFSSSLIVACGGGSSTHSSSATCPDLAGTWSVVSIDDNTKCGGSVETNTREAVVVQNGCSFSMTSDRDVVTGTGKGNQLVGTSKSSAGVGTTTGKFNGTASADGNTVTGTDTWTYKSSKTTCNGSSLLTATRMSDGGNSSTDPGVAGAPSTVEIGTGGASLGSGGSPGVGGGASLGGVANAAGATSAGGASGMGGSAGSTSSAGLCSLVGFYQTPKANEVIVAGSYAYVAEGASGIEILDVSNPAAPKSVGALPTTDATRLALNGTSLYVADGNGGLKVVDVSNPASPQLLATPTLLGTGPSGLQVLALSGTRLYGGYMNLDVFDVTIPAAPVAKGALSTTFLEDMVVDGTLVYAATAEGLQIFSALSTTPFLASSYDTNDWPQAVALASGYAYLGSSSGLSVVDVSNPSAPALAASSGLVKPINALSLQGNTLYVSGQGPGLSIMDISNPKAPKALGKCGQTAVASPGRMAISGQYGYVAGGTGGVVILKLEADTSNNIGAGGAGNAAGVGGSAGTGVAGAAGSSARSGACEVVGFYPAAQANHVVASGTHAYVAEGASGIEVLDIANPAQPISIGALPTTNALRLAVAGNDLYVADGPGGLKVIDVSTAASPQLVATPKLLVNGPSEVDSLVTDGSMLYAAYIGLNVFDLTNPASPLGKGSLSSTFIEDLAVEGTLVYAAMASGLGVFSVLSPTSPFLAGSYTNNDWGSAVAVSSGYAYYGSRSGLTVFDVTDPATPTVAASSGSLGNVKGITVHGSYLYVSGDGPGLSVVDVSNPKLPKAVAKCGELAVGTPMSMFIAGQYGLIAGGTGGVVIVKAAL